MLVCDRCGKEWKVTIDGEERVYFHNQGKIALEHKTGYPASRLAGYYDLEDEDKEGFLFSLGRRIGLPMWPLFVKRSFEREMELAASLGVLGPGGGAKDGYWELIVPECWEEALEKYPELQPGPEELREHERRLKELESHVEQHGIFAVCVYLCDNREKVVRDMDRATDLIQVCAVCSRPAEQVGIYRENEDSELFILHGMCPECTPGNRADPEKAGRMKEAVRDLLDSGRVRMLREEGDVGAKDHS
ncbi:MAG: hypothetical protein ACLFSY_03165 [Desulfonatronovibrionaceae bacterium]